MLFGGNWFKVRENIQKCDNFLRNSLCVDTGINRLVYQLLKFHPALVTKEYVLSEVKSLSLFIL